MPCWATAAERARRAATQLRSENAPDCCGPFARGRCTVEPRAVQERGHGVGARRAGVSKQGTNDRLTTLSGLDSSFRTVKVWPGQARTVAMRVSPANDASLHSHRHHYWQRGCLSTRSRWADSLLVGARRERRTEVRISESACVGPQSRSGPTGFPSILVCRFLPSISDCQQGMYPPRSTSSG